MTKSLYSVLKEAGKYLSEMDVSDINAQNIRGQLPEEAKTLKSKTNKKERNREWMEKQATSWKYPQSVNSNDIDITATHHWLSTAVLKSETQGFIVPAQDQSLKTRKYQHNILKNAL